MRLSQAQIVRLSALSSLISLLYVPTSSHDIVETDRFINISVNFDIGGALGALPHHVTPTTAAGAGSHQQIPAAHAHKFMETHLDILKYIEENMDKDKTAPDDIFLSTPELIKKYGYPCETHLILTKDGYLLTYHRIPHGKVPPSPRDARPKPTLVQHGLFSESTHWLTQPEHNVLPYMLADAGYDVWLGNSRGNRYSRQHVNYTTLDHQFWDTEWEQMGVYDLTAAIDYILEVTHYSKLNYLGHSMGSTMFLVLLSMRPEYNRKVNYFIGYAPPIFMKHVESPAIMFAPLLGIGGINSILVESGLGEFFPHNVFSYLENEYAPHCDETNFTTLACTTAVFTLCGFDKAQMNMTHLPVITATFPSSSPTPAMVHYFQEMVSQTSRFQKLDMGPLKNIEKYGALSPPSYRFSRMTVRKTLFYGQKDNLVGLKDVENTKGRIPNTDYVLVPFDEWGHMDFMWAKDAHKLVHRESLRILKQNDNFN